MFLTINCRAKNSSKSLNKAIFIRSVEIEVYCATKHRNNGFVVTLLHSKNGDNFPVPPEYYRRLFETLSVFDHFISLQNMDPNKSIVNQDLMELTVHGMTFSKLKGLKVSALILINFYCKIIHQQNRLHLCILHTIIIENNI